MRARQELRVENNQNVYYLIPEDDPEKFFRRSPWLVSDGDLWRWRAAVEAERELERG